MESGQQFKIDQPGLVRAAPITLIAGAISGITAINFYLWGINSLTVYMVPIFAGIWYIISRRKSGSTPQLTEAFVNGAILGVFAFIIHSIVTLMVTPIAFLTAPSDLGSMHILVDRIIVQLIFAAVGGSTGAFLMFMVK